MNQTNILPLNSHNFMTHIAASAWARHPLGRFPSSPSHPSSPSQPRDDAEDCERRRVRADPRRGRWCKPSTCLSWSAEQRGRHRARNGRIGK